MKPYFLRCLFLPLTRDPPPRRQKTVTEESENEEWRRKYGDEADKAIRASVDENIPHYEYLKSFAIKF